MIGYTKLFCDVVIDCRALRRTLYDFALVSMFVVDLVFIGSVIVLEDFFSLLYPNYFQSVIKCEVLSKLGNMSPSGFYAWNTKVMNSRSAAPLHQETLPLVFVEKRSLWCLLRTVNVPLRLQARLCG